MLVNGLTSRVMIDRSGDWCAKSVHGLSSMSRVEVEAFLAATARASARVVVAPMKRPKPAKIPRERHRERRR